MEQEDTNNMRYIIVPSEELEKVDFRKVLQSSPDSLRYSLDGKYFLLKYEGDQPEFVFYITKDLIGLPEHNHEQIIEIMNSSEWKSSDE
tara:strand:- start:65 stop:331 length:267 start_codon:yes stop_codon:yes gene_type:complete